MPMKNILKVAVLSLFLLGLLTVSAHAQNRYATVDLQKLFQNYYLTKQARASLKDRAAELDKTRKEMVDSVQKINDEYKKLLMDANDQAVTAEEREKRKLAAQVKLKELQDAAGGIDSFVAQAKTTLDEQQRRLTDNVLTKIREGVSAKARSAGFAMVFDTTAPVVVYSNGENDITDAVLSQLNATAPVETAPKPEEKKTTK